MQVIPNQFQMRNYCNLKTCAFVVFIQGAILNSKIKSNKNEHTDLFSTSEPILTRLKTGLFCRICSWSLTLAS